MDEVDEVDRVPGTTSRDASESAQL
jgi:hypothetical protein